MIYYKAWLESRARFFTGLIAASFITVLYIRLHPILIPQWKLALEQANTPKPLWLSLGVNDFRFYIWHFVYDYQMQEVWVLFAILLSFGGLTQEYIQGSIYFSLSLPVSRKRWIFTKIIVALLESLIIGLIPALLIPLTGLYFGLHYPISQGISHSLLMVTVGSIIIIISNFFALVLRSSYYISLSLVLLILGLPYIILQEYARKITPDSVAYHFDISHMMAGPWLLTWKNTPWTSIAILLAISTLILKLTVHHMEKIDF